MSAVRPILFSGPMVRALLDGTKTQTRRGLVRLSKFGKVTQFGRSDTRGYEWHFRDKCMRWHDLKQDRLLQVLPFAVGDLLWVREAWAVSTVYDGTAPRDINPEGKPGWCGIYYAATKAGLGIKNRAAIHMPRWASRITLDVSAVKVERLQSISYEDARDEGVDRRSRKVRQMWLFGASAEERERIYLQASPWEYRDVWESINGPGSWDANPWVAAYTFTVHHENVLDLIGKRVAS